MLKIFISGLKDGVYDIELVSEVKEIPLMFEEFFGDVTFKGTLRILGKRFTLGGKAECKAKLICDISLEEYSENVQAEIKSSFLADNSLMSFIKEELKDAEEHIIWEDDKYIDVTDIIREELALSLPMKRIAPKNRGKEFSELFPDLTKVKEEEKPVDEDKWAPLKKLKFN